MPYSVDPDGSPLSETATIALKYLSRFNIYYHSLSPDHDLFKTVVEYNKKGHRVLSDFHGNLTLKEINNGANKTAGIEDFEFDRLQLGEFDSVNKTKCSVQDQHLAPILMGLKPIQFPVIKAIQNLDLIP
eukprot:NODE_13_length_54415_cov_0.522424.p44 type:complete len:130 gc:universal NODE_13_length_54415_cov_0.522424:433-822(+)